MRISEISRAQKNPTKESYGNLKFLMLLCCIKVIITTQISYFSDDNEHVLRLQWTG